MTNFTKIIALLLISTILMGLVALAASFVSHGLGLQSTLMADSYYKPLYLLIGAFGGFMPGLFLFAALLFPVPVIAEPVNNGIDCETYIFNLSAPEVVPVLTPLFIGQVFSTPGANCAVRVKAIKYQSPNPSNWINY